MLSPEKCQGPDEWTEHTKRAPLAKGSTFLVMWVETGDAAAMTATVLIYAPGSALESIHSSNVLLLIKQGCNRFLFLEPHTRKKSVKHISLVYELLLKENPISVYSAYLHPYQVCRSKLVFWFLQDIRNSCYRLIEVDGLLCTRTGFPLCNKFSFLVSEEFVSSVWTLEIQKRLISSQSYWSQ